MIKFKIVTFAFQKMNDNVDEHIAQDPGDQGPDAPPPTLTRWRRQRLVRVGMKWQRTGRLVRVVIYCDWIDNMHSKIKPGEPKLPKLPQ